MLSVWYWTTQTWTSTTITTLTHGPRRLFDQKKNETIQNEKLFVNVDILPEICSQPQTTIDSCQPFSLIQFSNEITVTWRSPSTGLNAIWLYRPYFLKQRISNMLLCRENGWTWIIRNTKIVRKKREIERDKYSWLLIMHLSKLNTWSAGLSTLLEFPEYLFTSHQKCVRTSHSRHKVIGIHWSSSVSKLSFSELAAFGLLKKQVGGLLQLTLSITVVILQIWFSCPQAWLCGSFQRLRGAWNVDNLAYHDAYSRFTYQGLASEILVPQRERDQNQAMPPTVICFNLMMQLLHWREGLTGVSPWTPLEVCWQSSRSLHEFHWISSCSQRSLVLSWEWWKAWPFCCHRGCWRLGLWWSLFWSPGKWHSCS